MEVKQIAQILNEVVQETTGETGVVAEDLSNINEIGGIFTNKIGVDASMKAIVNKIGKTVYSSDLVRTYRGAMPNIMVDGARYGSITEKIRIDYPDAEESDVYDLNDGDSPEQFQYKQPHGSEKFYNENKTWKIMISVMRRQYMQSFRSAEAASAFFDMLFKVVETRITMQIDSLTSKLYTGTIGDTLYNEYSGAGYGDSSKVKAVNLLYLYNNGPNAGGTPLKAANCLSDQSFLKFASYTMAMYSDWITGMSVLYNMGGTMKFTPKENQRWVMLADFANAADFYLSSDTFHNEFVKLPTASKVPYWQGSGNNAATANFFTRSKIYVTTPENHSVEQTGILAVLHDEATLGVNLADRYADTARNVAGQFVNYFYFVERNNFVDYDENFIVFFVADATPSSS